VEFKPRLPREGINVSATHPLKEAATLVAGLAAVVVGLVFVVAWSTDFAVGLISPDTEALLFESLSIESAVDVTDAIDDRQNSVQELLDRMADHWEDTPYEFKVIVFPSGDINAVALPGGYIMVTSALLDQVDSENELAFVLGHELGHFHNRDHLRSLGRVVVYRLALGAVLGSAGSVPDLAGKVGDLTSRTFDRDQERAADRFGLDLVHSEYGHVGATWKFFRRLTNGSPSVARFVAYLSTHPASSSRIDDLRRYAEERGWEEEGTAKPLEE